MKSIASKWFECIISYEKVDESTMKAKKQTEVYVVDALSFTEAEARITDETSNKGNVVNSFEIKNINPAPYKEVFFSDMDKDDRWYKIKVAFITYDENTGKEKLTKVTYLVQGDKAEQAHRYIDEVMKQGMLEYRITDNVETKIMDVFKHESHE